MCYRHTSKAIHYQLKSRPAVQLFVIIVSRWYSYLRHSLTRNKYLWFYLNVICIQTYSHVACSVSFRVYLKNCYLKKTCSYFAYPVTFLRSRNLCEYRITVTHINFKVAYLPLGDIVWQTKLWWVKHKLILIFCLQFTLVTHAQHLASVVR